MRYRILGKTGIRVSEIGFGSWAISGKGYGSTDDSESIDVLNKALDLGINFIDTADSYGNGHSETLIGRVLSERKDVNPVICTKFGWDFYNRDGIRSNLDSEYIDYALDKSLKRLNRKVIDVYLIHSQNPRSILDFDVHTCLINLKRKGMIRYCGVSVSDHYAKEYVPLILGFDWDVIELTYNLLDRQLKSLLFEPCIRKNTGIIIKEPLACGMLTGKYTKSSVFQSNDHRNGWSRVYLNKRIATVDNIKYKLNLTNTDLIKTSLKYILNTDAVSTVIPGMKNIDQLNENISSIDYNLKEETISWLEQN